ncbi:bifunctional copper resistance protein CopD/cytochrome c oxidase assembly protein [Corynebacterium sp. CCM 8862]|uniref:Bifunctional copper resistance protein CopD/cytochrome c oxidase assembly protein n=2 Tax=Corynebacterium mendelii TaxID=2765362 RepID=A0A939E1M4_9CORY|nr:cytochrome c oxidase assembly protein [Corynebacterium mendelii]MBN9644148.1 bifunctional copper resistance protein CopD/cytochrome c oxidase assembly protein [Corynebacterium mendelii]
MSKTPDQLQDAAPGSPGNSQLVHPRQRPRGSGVLMVLFFLAAGAVGAAISYGFLAESLQALGISDPGIVTTAGLPFIRSGALMMAALSGGSFLFSSFLTPPKDADKVDLLHARLDVDGTLAARTGAIAAAVYGLCAMLLVPLYLSDVSGEPLFETIKLRNWPVAIEQVSTSLAFFAVGLIAFATAIGAVLSNRWCFQPLALFGAICGIIPLGLEGHSAAGGDHDYGTNSYLWHLLFFVFWVGGLMALIQHGRRRGTHMALAVRRYSSLALWSTIGMAISGVINAAIRIPWDGWFSSGYGWLMFAKACGIVVLALFGFWHRTATLPKIEADEKNDRYFRRVAIGEVLVMCAVVGVAISLSRTPPPPPIVADINTMDIQLGYKLYKEPTFWNVWTMWRFDIAFGTIAVLLAFAYLWGVLRLKARGEKWPWQLTAWFISGCVLLGLTMCSGIGMNIPATFSMHMIGHMILTMGVPPLWVLGAPFTLWDRAIRPGPPGIPGPREWLRVFTDNPLLRWQMQPYINSVQFVVLFYLLYLTPLYDFIVWEHAGHLGMNIVFLWSGYIYYWELIGQDPKPVERSAMSRGAWLIFSMPFHLFFGITLIHTGHIMAESFYSNLGLPWDVDLAWDQAVGGGIAWASGQFPLVIVFGVVFWEWYREDRREQKNYDEYADATGDADMEEYNRMLARLSGSDHSGGEDIESYFHKELTPGPKKKHRAGSFFRVDGAPPVSGTEIDRPIPGVPPIPPGGKKFTDLTPEEYAEWERQQHGGRRGRE